MITTYCHLPSFVINKLEINKFVNLYRVYFHDKIKCTLKHGDRLEFGNVGF